MEPVRVVAGDDEQGAGGVGADAVLGDQVGRDGAGDAPEPAGGVGELLVEDGDALRELERVCRGSDNIMPAMMEALDADVTLGEVGDVWRGVFGDWNTPIQT